MVVITEDCAFVRDTAKALGEGRLPACARPAAGTLVEGGTGVVQVIPVISVPAGVSRLPGLIVSYHVGPFHYRVLTGTFVTVCAPLATYRDRCPSP